MLFSVMSAGYSSTLMNSKFIPPSLTKLKALVGNQWIFIIYHALNLLSLPSEPPGKPSWNSNNFSTWCEQLTHWKRSWCWERLKAEGEEGNRGWDGWMASLIQWTWTWTSSGKWWGTGKPGMVQSTGSQRVDTTWWLNNNKCICVNVILSIRPIIPFPHCVHIQAEFLETNLQCTRWKYTEWG